MEFVKFSNNWCGSFVSQDSSNIEMCILGDFLSSDVSWHCVQTYKEWGLHPEAEFMSGNITQLEIKIDGIIYLSSTIPVEEEDRYFVELKLTRK